MYHCEPEVKIIADSINPDGDRIISIQCKYWRPLLAEVNTHRVFSRNSRSSRATPTKELLKQVRENPWGPREFGINQAGMVANSLYSGSQRELIIKAWEKIADANGSLANSLEFFNLHKQTINRLLEPYTYAVTLITADKWDNFFKLRIANDAQPEMRDLAVAIKKAMEESTPDLLDWGDWHLPYITEEDKKNNSLDVLLKVSAARCARVSYKCFDGTTSIAKDLELANKLKENKHFSPFEMVAQASKENTLVSNFNNSWLQYRKLLENNIEPEIK